MSSPLIRAQPAQKTPTLQGNQAIPVADSRPINSYRCCGIPLIAAVSGGPTAGTRLGPHEITAYIGAGNGELYCACDIKLGQLSGLNGYNPAPHARHDVSIGYSRRVRRARALSL